MRRKAPALNRPCTLLRCYPTSIGPSPRPNASPSVARTLNDIVLVVFDPIVEDTEGDVPRTPPNVADGVSACKEGHAHFEEELVDGWVRSPSYYLTKD